MRPRYFPVLLVLVSLVYSFAPSTTGTDLSTPHKAFETLVEVLESGEHSRLKEIVTPTGLHSLESQQVLEDSEKASVLVQEWEDSEQDWMEITEDIYFLKAQSGDKIHKLEFTREEPGWMLYHWQLGGGSDSH